MKVKFVNSRGQGKFNAPRYFTQGAMSGANGEIRFSPPSSPQERTGEFQESRSASIISSPIHRKASARTLSTAPTIYSSPSFASLRSTRSENELLTFFQSGPLVYEDEDYNLKPVGMLDFKTERNVLRNALAHAEVKVDVTFDYACTDRLSKFLIQGRGRVLHYSGHGHSQYLAIEDCWGKMHPLNVDDLKGWIKAGREQLLLVFVSACHSRAAGDAFIEAGVKHVVCCKRDDQLLRNDAAIEFEKAFYQALANGRTLREAFEHGRHKVKTSNQMNPEVAQSEAQNFVLLPEGKDHNVKIFDPDIPPRPREICAEEQALISGGYNGMIPNPPDNFEGRQIEMFQVLSALKEHRLVRVTGPRGIGKCSVVRGVCKYIRERFHVFANTISHIVWLDQIDEDGKLGLSVLSDDENDFFHEKNSFTSLLEKALFFLKDRQVLLLIDARKLKCVSVFDEFLRDIIQMTDDTKVILIERSSGVGRIQRLQPSEKEVHIRPLSFLSTLHLFGKLCPHVDNQRCAEMWNLKALRGLILPEGLSSGELDTKVGMDIYEMIGAGIPSNIQEVADSISIERYKRLVILLDGMRRVRSSKTELHFQTRTELENEISDVTKQEQEAVKNCDYKQAGILKTLLDELMKLREHLKPLAELEEMEQIRSTRLNSALSKREYDDAAAIWEELLSLRRKIEAENSAIRGRRILKRHTSHFGLAARLSTLNQEFEKAMSEDRYAEAKHLRSQVLSLEQQLSRKRSLEELKNELKRIIDKLMEAKATANCELCEDLTRERLTLERLIIIENEARSSPDSLDSFQDVTIPPEYQASTTPCKNEPKLGKRRLHTFSDNGKSIAYLATSNSSLISQIVLTSPLSCS
jgi:protein-arginine kinase activator protein McsA